MNCNNPECKKALVFTSKNSYKKKHCNDRCRNRAHTIRRRKPSASDVSICIICKEILISKHVLYHDYCKKEAGRRNRIRLKKLRERKYGQQKLFVV